MNYDWIIVGLRELPFRRVSRLGFHLLLQSGKLLRHLGPQPGTRLRWDEFQNKLRAFLAFEYADLRLKIDAEPRQSLDKLISKAELLGSEFSAFDMEGIAYHLAKAELKRHPSAPCLSFLKDYAGCSPGTLVPLHAGLGLAVAESSLHAIDKQTAELTQSLSRFGDFCRRCSHPGYAGVTFEALGFVAATLLPHLIAVVDGSLAADDEGRAYFWHGMGRGSYFVPANSSPINHAQWKALDVCMRKPPDDLGKQNAIAGFAWALTIINLHQPEIMANFLKHHGCQIGGDDAFRQGVQSAAELWGQIYPGDARLQAFQRYQPEALDPNARELWDRCVERTFAAATLEHSSCRLSGGPEALFRYRGEYLESTRRLTSQVWRLNSLPS